MNELELILPNERYAEQVMSYKEEMLENNDTLDGCEGLEEVKSYAEWADFEGRLKAKYKQGYVPSQVYLAINKTEDRLVGIIDIRYTLTDYLYNYGGNIGYSVRPSERRRGWAKQMLEHALEKTKQYGLKRVLVTCDADNEASRRTILANGGVLENEVEAADGQGNLQLVQRYWIEL